MAKEMEWAGKRSNEMGKESKKRAGMTGKELE